MQVKVHAIDSLGWFVAIFFWSIPIHEAKYFELSIWSNGQHLIINLLYE